MLTAWLVLSKATDRIGTPAALCMFDPPGIPHADGPQEECACPCSNERIDSQIRAIWIDLQSALGQRVRSSNCSLYRFSAIETHLQN